jgi:hypothetical protein
MPYTPSVTAYLAHLEHEMHHFRVIDPTINASHGTVQAPNEDHAKDIVVAKMGWKSYAEYTAAAANHNGTRTLEAVKIKVSA